MRNNGSNAERDKRLKLSGSISARPTLPWLFRTRAVSSPGLVPHCGDPTTPSFRSVLYFEQTATTAGPKRTHAYTGPQAIEHYLQAEEKGRLFSRSNRICPAAP